MLQTVKSVRVVEEADLNASVPPVPEIDISHVSYNLNDYKYTCNEFMCLFNIFPSTSCVLNYHFLFDIYLIASQHARSYCPCAANFCRRVQYSYPSCVCRVQSVSIWYTSLSICWIFVVSFCTFALRPQFLLYQLLINFPILRYASALTRPFKSVKFFTQQWTAEHPRMVAKFILE